MPTRFAGPTNSPSARPAAALIAATALLAAVLSLVSLPTLRSKERARASDRAVALAVDADDLRAFVPADRRSAFLQSLRAIPAAVMTVRETLSSDDEAAYRAAGFRLLWRLEDGADSGAFPKRLKTGDGVVVAGEYALESPGMGESVAAALKANGGFLSIVEFSPARPLLHLPSLLSDRLVRTHIIPTRETVRPKPDLWRQRIVRAANDRAVRLIAFRFSSRWSAEQNLAFLVDAAARLREAGHVVGDPAPLAGWRAAPGWAAWGAVLLASLAPVAGVVTLSLQRGRGALLPFTLVTLASAAAGVVVHGLIASPGAVAGVAAARGVKIQLALPLLLGAFFLLDRHEVASVFKRTVTWGDLALVGLVAVGGLAVYLMRSGNDPLIPVSDVERRLRDALEAGLGARPRFKEFAIGHPLLIAGLFLRRRGAGFWRDGRGLLLLGLIGQISVVNTFVHAPAPLAASLLRTFHGWWAGALVSIPLCLWLRRALAAPAARGRAAAS